jgi:signal transduction histidine kinase
MITDNGDGINKEIQKNIFDPFFTTKPVGSGTGLGLSISHQIVVEKHGGNLSCISAPGYGTTFVVEIPLCCAICAEINEMNGEGLRLKDEGLRLKV